MIGDFRDHLHVRARLRQDQLVDPFHAAFGQVHQRLDGCLFVFVFLSRLVFASPIIDEELYVIGSVEEVKDLAQSGSIVIDHVTEYGFELYGPAGLKKHLN